MNRHLTLRLGSDELLFLDRLAKEKGVTRSEVLRRIFMQQVALTEIEKSVAAIVDSRLAALGEALQNLSQKIDQTASRDDLIKSTNFLIKELKK